MASVDDPGILCFQHCSTTVKIFCLELPDHCPCCQCPIRDDSVLKLPPMEVPFPFVPASRAICSILIRPTEGDFLHYYRNQVDLHIGVTDSTGHVYEFDRNGLHRGTRNHLWNQSLVISITPERSPEWLLYWDQVLSMTSDMNELWHPERYNKDGHNCYSFVMAFLRALQIPSLRSSLMSKTHFCRDYIVPRTKVAAKYIALYRQVIKDAVAVIPIAIKASPIKPEPDRCPYQTAGSKMSGTTVTVSSCQGHRQNYN